MVTQAIDIAAQQIGLTETGQRAALQDYLSTGGQNLDPATTAWCAAFVNATLEQSGQKGTGALNARSYLDWGQEVTEPQRGDVAVFSRGDPNGWQGHVGFFDGYNEDGTIRVLGGNQGDAVSIAGYDPSRLLGFRRANDPTAAQNAMAPAPQNAMPQAEQQNALRYFQPQNTQLDASAFMQPQNAMARQGFV